jgi:SulP family sulfate permease
MILFPFEFRPKLLDSLKNYKIDDFWQDLSAGVTVAFVALPLAMAFAIASGLKPEAGIFTAIIAGLIISGLGGSKVQIGGPAGAFIVIVYGIVLEYGVSGLILSTILAGILLFIMGMFRLGSLVRFVPVSIVIGFTNGIAVLIALSQIKDVLGLKIENMPADFFPKIGSILTHINTISISTILLSTVSLIIVCGWTFLTTKLNNNIFTKIPGSIVALVVGTAAVALFNLPVETIGTRFGGIPDSLPALTLPAFDLNHIQNLIRPAITIALLCAIESLLCARVADGLIRDRHNPNQELMAQGLANIAVPLFGGFCATGTIARTVTNIRLGAKSPISGIIHSLTILLIILVAAPLAKNIPLATLGAILLFVAYRMGEWHEFVRLKHFSNNYRVILLTTFTLTVVMDLTIAIEVGLTLACLSFITRISALSRIEPIAEMETFGFAHLGKEIEAYHVYGSLFFGSVHKLEEISDPKREISKVLILDMENLINIDTTGMEALESLYETLTQKGSQLLLASAKGQPLSIMQRSGFVDQVGEGYLFTTLNKAFECAENLLNEKRCLL